MLRYCLQVFVAWKWEKEQIGSTHLSNFFTDCRFVLHHMMEVLLTENSQAKVRGTRWHSVASSL